MHLYEINTEIALLMQQLEVDEETGEILTSSEDILQQLNALDMERSRILEYLAQGGAGHPCRGRSAEG